MADPLTDLLDPTRNPYVDEGLKRRLVPPPSAAPVETFDPYAGNWAAETTRSQAQRLANYAPAFEVLARRAAGDGPGVQDAAQRYLEGEERARALGPEVQTFDDAASGGGVGDYASAIGYQAAAFVPDVALSLTGAGLGAIGARQVAKGLVRRSVERQVGEFATQRGVREAARSQAAQQAGRAALQATNAPRTVAAAMTGARESAEAQLNRQISALARNASLRTPRDAALIRRATIGGRVVGAAAGQFPGLNTGNVEILAAPEATSTDALKAAAGTTAASALGALPVERFFRRFGAPASQAVQQTAQRLLPRVAKEYARQGLAEATTEVAQTATQLAGHRWIDENVDLLGPQALDQYLAGAIGGFVAGGVLGAAGEAGRAGGDALAAGARKVRTWAGDARTQTRDALAKVADRARALTGRRSSASPAPGAELGPGGPDAPVGGGTAADRLRAGLDSLKGAARAAGGVAGRFRDNLRGVQASRDLDADTDEVVGWAQALNARYEAGEDTLLPALTNRPQTHPVQMATKWQNALAGYIAREHPIWQRPDDARRAAEVLEKIAFNRDLDADDADLLDDLTAGEAPAVTLAVVRRLEAAAPQLAQLRSALQRVGGQAQSDADDAPISVLGREDVARAAPDADPRAVMREDDARQIDTRDASGGISERTAEPLPTADRLNSLAQTGLALRAQVRRVSEAGDTAAVTALRTEQASLRKAYAATRDALKTELLGGSGVFVRNSKGKGPEHYAQRKASAGYVELAEPATIQLTNKTIQQPQLLDLGALILRQRSRLRAEGAAADEIPAKTALLRGLAEATQAGVAIKPATLTPGQIKDRNGRVLMTLTRADVAQLRGQTRLGGLNPRSLARGDVATERLERDEALAGEDVVDSGDDPARFKLGPRTPPPGRRAASGDFVPEQTGLSDVSATTPYEAVVNQARRTQAPATTPRARAEALHTAGVEIGTAELARQRDTGTITPRRHALETKRLNTPTSGLSRRYLRNAAAGRFDTVKVREQPADVAAPEGSDREFALRDDTYGAVERRAQIRERLTQANRRRWKTASPAMRAEILRAEQARALETRQGKAPKLTEAASFNAAPTSPGTQGERPLKRGTQAATLPEQSKPDDHRAIDAGLRSAATRAPAPHDLAKEQAMLNAVLERLGFSTKVRVVALSPEAQRRHFGGGYHRRTQTVHIHPTLSGAQRVEVLLHELGHHIVWAEVAKAANLDLAHVVRLDDNEALTLLEKNHPTLHAALRQDFEAWKAWHPSSLPVGVVRASRAPLHIGARFLHGAMQAPGRSVTSLDAAQQAYTYDFHEWLADNIARALSGKHDGQTVIGKFFNDIVTALRKAYAAVFARNEAKQWAPADSVDAWIQGLFDANIAAVGDALGHPVSGAQAKTTIRAAAADAVATMTDADVPAPPGAPPTEGGGGDRWNPDPAALIAFVRDVMNLRTRQTLDRVLNRAVVVQRLRKVYADEPALLALLDDAKAGLENRIALAYLAWRGGNLTVGPNGRSAMIDVADDLAAVFGAAGEGDLAQRIFNDIATGAIQRFHNANKTYDVRQLEARSRGALQHALNRLSDVRERVGQPIARFFDSKVKRMYAAGVPALREIAALIQRPQGTTGDDRGLNPALVHTTAQFARRAQQALAGLSARETQRVVQMMQRQLVPGDVGFVGNAKVQHALGVLRRMFDDAHAYLTQAGVDVGVRQRFFPVVFDLRNDATRDVLTRLYSQPKFEAAIRQLIGDKNATTPIADLVKDLVDGAAQQDGLLQASQDGAPSFRSANYRLSQFVYALGDANDIKAFARVQSKNVAEIFARYIEPMVRRAEYARRFGDDGAKLKRLLETARKQGAAQEDLDLARDAVRAALGIYGLDGSPVLRMLSPKLAERFSGPKSRAFVQGMQAYQNARLLPLSTLSSLVDPMGIAVRTGGDFKVAWDGWKLGIKSLYDQQTKAEVHQMLQMLGATEDMSTLESLHGGFGGAGNPTARAVNEFVFKWNGLAAWTRTTRYMALTSAHQFLLKHADSKTDASKRYFAELGLQPGDVEAVTEPLPDGRERRRVRLLTEAERMGLRASRTPNKVAEILARDDRVRNALSQFVDEAILRPNSQQTPLWYSDPYVGLVTQYKAFAYAIYDQIGGRVARELKHANLRVLLPALGYLPVVMAAELLRELIQHGPDGDPRRKQWNAADYTKLAADRSGLLGPTIATVHDIHQDIQYGRPPGASQIGPAASQARELLTTHDIGKSFEAALPASAAWKRWNDQPATRG